LVQNENSKSDYSDTWSFTTIDSVKVLSPADGLVLATSKDVEFKWTKITGIRNYELQLSKDKEHFFAPVKYLIVPTVEKYTVKNIKDGEWYWRIRAKTSDSTEWSIPRSIKITSVGIENISNTNTNVNVYPVPCKDKCFVSFDNISKNDNLRIELLNILGQNLMTNNVENMSSSFVKEVDLNRFEDGVYFIRVYNGSNSLTRKILIKK
jgi:hypothetical protein